MRVVVDGKPIFEQKNPYIKPNALGPIHQSLTRGWLPLEWIPKAVKWQEWPRRALGGFYLPRAEPRRIGPDDDGALPCIHQSAIDRNSELASYAPESFPTNFVPEPY